MSQARAQRNPATHMRLPALLKKIKFFCVEGLVHVAKKARFNVILLKINTLFNFNLPHVLLRNTAYN